MNDLHRSDKMRKDEYQDKRKWTFTIVDNAVLYSLQLSEHEKIIYTLLCSFANSRTNECFPSIKTLAEYAKVSQNTVRVALKGLKEKGLIGIKERKIDGINLSNLYEICELPKWILEEYQNRSEGTSTDEGVLQQMKGGTSPVEVGVLQQMKGGTSPVEDELYQYNYNHINKNNITNDDEGEQHQQIKKIIDVFNNNIHNITPIEFEKLNSWLEDVEADVIVKAIEEAVTNNKRSMNYINKILNNWHSMGLKTKADVEEYLRNWSKKKEQPKSSWKEADLTGLM